MASNRRVGGLGLIACAVLCGCDGSRDTSGQRELAGVSATTGATDPATTSQLAVATRPPSSEQDQRLEELLAEVEAKLKQTPKDPMLHYRRAQHLMGLRRYETGFEAAKKAMACFKEAHHNLSWMKIDSIDLPGHRIDVHFNMGPDERTPPDMGITRPLSFRVWTKDESASLAFIIDYEVGYSDGKPDTAAFGSAMGPIHANFGVLDTNLTYQAIREAAKELIARRLADKQ